MKHPVIIAMVLIFLASAIAPLYAEDKRMENNKKIGQFILDTVKLPYVLMGAFVHQDHERAKKETNYKGHKTLGECLR